MSQESFEAKLFVEFIALIVRNRICNLLKEMMLRLETRQKYMTVPAAIRELEKIELVRGNAGKYRLECCKIQLKILQHSKQRKFADDTLKVFLPFFS